MLRQRVGWIVFAAAVAVTAQAALCAVPLAQFADTSAWTVIRGDTVNAQLEPVTTTNATRGARLTWQADHPPYIELQLRKPVRLAAFDQSLDGSLIVGLIAEGRPVATQMSLRLRDSKGEVFQWTHPLALAKSGPVAVEFPLSATSFAGNWNTHGTATGRIKLPVELVGIAITLAKDAAPGNIVLTGISYGKAKLPLSDRLQVSLQTGRPLNILTLKDPPEITLRIDNRDEKPAELNAHVTVEPFDGEASQFDQSLRIDAESSQRWTLPLELKGQGLWRLHCTFSEAGGDSTFTWDASIARMDPAGPDHSEPAQFLFGLNSHATRFSRADQEREVFAAALAGARIMRCGVGWEHIQPTADQWNWSEMDYFEDLLAKYDIKSQVLLGFTPRWASTADPGETSYSIWSRMPPRLDAWQAYVHAMVERYHNRVAYWELWNEPDLSFFRGSADDMLAMARVASQTARQVDPSVRIMSPGFSSRPDGEKFIEQFLRQGHDYFDVLAWHQHGTFESLRQIVDERLANLRQKYAPGKPLFFNESGFAVPDISPHSQRLQCEAMIKKIAFLRSRGSIGHMWYELRDDVIPSSSVESSFGLLDHQFNPKAPYVTYNTLTRLLTDKRFIASLDTGSQASALLFANDHQQVLVTWADTHRDVQQRVLQTDATAASVVDMFGNARPITVLSGGQVVIDLSTEPAFVVLQGARQPATLGAKMLSPVAGTLLPGRRNALVYELYNPASQPQQMTVQLSLPKSLGGQNLTQQKLVAPQQSARIAFDVDVPQLSADAHVENPQTTVAYHSADDTIAGKMTMPLSLGRAVGGMPFDRAPDYDLHDARDIVNLFPDDPYQVQKQWKGPTDLSAKVWFGVRGDVLHVRVQVTDDVFDQPNQADFWKADSVQLAFVAPGQSGMWELTLARLANGGNTVVTTGKPVGAADDADQVSLHTQLRDGGITYDIAIPCKAFGIQRAMLAQGIRMSLLVNDSDKLGREGWVQVSPGIGGTKDASRFPLLVFPQN